MQAITVYYHILDTDDGIYMALTGKTYWDANQCVDDGEGPDYMAIHDAMDALGMREDSESTYELASLADEDRIVAGMKAQGFDLVRNQDFADWLTYGNE